MTDNPSGASDNGCYRTPAKASKPAADCAFLLNAWLHGRPVNTAKCYRRDAGAFISWLAVRGKSLPLAELDDLQVWAASLTGAPRSIARRVAAVRSMLGFATKLGYLPRDPSTLLRVGKPAGGAPRILSETDVQRMFGSEPDLRARAALRLLYVTGIRNSELCALRYRHVTIRKKSVDASVLGKGNKDRTVSIPAALWREIADLSPGAKPDDPVIAGRDGKPIGARALHRLVRRAARRIGLVGVSPHWMRHAHASHALDHGAPIHLVKENLGHASIVTTSGYAHAREGDSSSAYMPL